MMRNVLYLAIFLMSLFSIMGVQILAGTLRTRCQSVATGNGSECDSLCGIKSGFECSIECVIECGMYAIEYVIECQ